MKTSLLPSARSWHPGLAALVETAVLFLPAVPAYLWLWPNLSGPFEQWAQLGVYLYVLAGALLIGRRWSWADLGFNRRGFGFSLAAGFAVLLGRSLVILSVTWGLPAPAVRPLQLLGLVLFYFGAVGLVEELLFRGLIYRALQDWLGATWAVWGSSFAFALWHVFGQGPLAGAAVLFYGLIFALIRWRAGGIVGLVLVHGAIDVAGTVMLPGSISLERPEIAYPWLLGLGLWLILLTPLVLWRSGRSLLFSTRRTGRR